MVEPPRDRSSRDHLQGKRGLVDRRDHSSGRTASDATEPSADLSFTSPQRFPRVSGSLPAPYPASMTDASTHTAPAVAGSGLRTAELLSVGTELTVGDTRDTNA